MSDVRPALRRIAAEALILQDEAELVIRSARGREGMCVVARRGGPLVRRFFSLRDLLPAAGAAPDVQLRARLDAILHHHALAVSLALELLACEGRSARMAALLDGLEGLGRPALDLEQIYAELTSPSR